MTVNELRDTLTQLVALLRAADAKATTTRGLTEFIEAIGPFGDLKLAAFVKLAEVASRPVAAPTPKAKGPPKAKSKLDPSKLAADVRELYDRAGDPAVTEEQIEVTCAGLNALGKDGLVVVADGLELYGMKSAKNKGVIVKAITDRILDRKRAAVRRHLIDRPQPQDNGGDLRGQATVGGTVVT